MASAKHKSFQNFLFSVGGVVAMFLLLAGVYVLFTFISVRMDLTEEKAYTLSDGTKAILEKLDTPVTIRFYATQGEDMPVMLKTYAQRIEDLLKEYQKHSGGKIIVRKYDPEPLSDAEDSANLDGVEGQQIDLRTQIYLGISVSMLDSKETLPFLDLRRERLLEYDLTRAIANVMTTEKPLVGVMSSLPVFGQMNPMMMQMGGGSQPPWLIINELKRDYEVREVQTSATEIDPEIGILLVIHPKNLPEATLYALDQFVLRGGNLMVFVDPLSVVDAQSAPGNNPLQGAMNATSSLDQLTKAWGIEFDSSKVVADQVYMAQISRSGRPETAPAVLALDSSAVNTNDVVTSQISSLVFPFSGVFTGTPAEGLTQSVLVHTSPKSQLVEKFMAQFSGEQVLQNFEPSGQEYPLAIRLTGTFKTAFPEGNPSTNTTSTASHRADSAEKGSVVLVADSDLIYDRFVAQIQNLLGRQLIFPLNENLALVQNIVEQTAGDENLIAIRSRATMNRPFTRVREMEIAAQERYREKIQQLEQNLQETQTRLNELQQGKETGQRFILSPEQEQELAKFRRQEVEVQKELKQVEKDLRREIESLENRLKWVNIAGMPLLVTLVGLTLAFVKRKKTAAK